MSDHVRDLVRAAQAAELRGNVSEAVELLAEAAQRYEEASLAAKAEQMRRHVARLRGEPFAPLNEEGAKSIDAAQLQRGPVRADPSLDAWCSFCCRPRGEAGDLVAGPAGAFICGACVKHSSALCGARLEGTSSALGAAPREAPFPVVRDGPGEAAREEVLRGLDAGARLVLVLGPIGSGKSTLLRELANAGVGRYLTAGQLPVGSERVLVDLEGADWPHHIHAMRAFLAGPGQPQAVIAVRGLPVRGRRLLGAATEVALFSSADLVEATGGQLPVELAELAHVVVTLHRSLDQLQALVQRWLEARGVELAQGSLKRLMEWAMGSGRGLHELRALVDRLPPGHWSLEAAGRAPAPGRAPKRRPLSKK